MAYETLLVEVDGAVGIITLNRPDALNALSSKLCAEVVDQLAAWEKDANIGCVIITGAGRAFAAGADIKEMAPQSYMDVYKGDMFAAFEHALSSFRKPIVAAVNGFALGGGCELAMLCDFILASEAAKFGQPEINLGVMPGIGGSQRLTRFVGKSKAMEMCLTGRMMDAAEAERSGLASRVLPADKLMEEARAVARKIASQSGPIAMMTKESVNSSYETTLRQGIMFERRLFHSMFATDDQKEGMAAFVEKRPAKFSNM
jgi:enoyl-CoA hydratase